MSKPLSALKIFERGTVVATGTCEETMPMLQKLLVVNAARFCDENYTLMFDQYSKLVEETMIHWQRSYESIHLFMFHRHGISVTPVSSSLRQYDKVLAVKFTSVQPGLGLGPEHIKTIEIRDATDKSR